MACRIIISWFSRVRGHNVIVISDLHGSYNSDDAYTYCTQHQCGETEGKPGSIEAGERDGQAEGKGVKATLRPINGCNMVRRPAKSSLVCFAAQLPHTATHSSPLASSLGVSHLLAYNLFPAYATLGANRRSPVVCVSHRFVCASSFEPLLPVVVLIVMLL